MGMEREKVKRMFRYKHELCGVIFPDVSSSCVI